MSKRIRATELLETTGGVAFSIHAYDYEIERISACLRGTEPRWITDAGSAVV